MEHTSHQYKEVISQCRALFVNKMKDYGPAWRILRLPSLTDQIYIKAQRVRSIEQKGKQLVEDDLRGEFIGILNYSIMALIQLELGVVDKPDMDSAEATAQFDKWTQKTMELMERKNHDYGEAWREMRISSITDLILQKILRIKQIEDNQGETIVSEGLEANYMDMVNYAAFVLIKMGETEKI